VLVLWDLCFCFHFWVSVVGFVFLFLLLCWCCGFWVSVFAFVLVLWVCVSVFTFGLVLWVLCFCFHFCVNVVGFVFLFSLLC